MLKDWLIELIGHVSGLSDAQLRQFEKSLPASKALIELLIRAQPIIEEAQKLYAEAEPLIDEAMKEWQTVGPAAQILIDVIGHHVNKGSSPTRAAEAVRTALGVVNAISLYVEHGSDTFHSVHVETAARIASVARRAGAQRLVHLSGIGADAASPSPYIRSRGEGEAAVQAAFPGAVIIRPAVMFASDGGFLTTILKLLRALPAYPIFGDGRTRLQPAYVDHLAAAITQVLRQSKKPYPIYELAGPRVYSYEELLRTIARTAGLRPVLMRMPFALWDVFARVAEILPHQPLTRNQVELMQIDTTASYNLPGFRVLGISPRSLEEL